MFYVVFANEATGYTSVLAWNTLKEAEDCVEVNSGAEGIDAHIVPEKQVYFEIFEGTRQTMKAYPKAVAALSCRYRRDLFYV